MSDLITAIIPTYKRPFKLLERALRSVLAQTYRNIEVVVVDDSPSTYQGRAEIAANIHLDDRVTYIQHDAQKGACAARNTGLAHANGKYIAFLDDDDEWLPEKIELQYRRIGVPIAPRPGFSMKTCCERILSDRHPSCFWTKLFWRS